MWPLEVLSSTSFSRSVFPVVLSSWVLHMHGGLPLMRWLAFWDRDHFCLDSAKHSGALLLPRDTTIHMRNKNKDSHSSFFQSTYSGWKPHDISDPAAYATGGRSHSLADRESPQADAGHTCTPTRVRGCCFGEGGGGGSGSSGDSESAKLMYFSSKTLSKY